VVAEEKTKVGLARKVIQGIDQFGQEGHGIGRAGRKETKHRGGKIIKAQKKKQEKGPGGKKRGSKGTKNRLGLNRNTAGETGNN